MTKPTIAASPEFWRKAHSWTEAGYRKQALPVYQELGSCVELDLDAIRPALLRAKTAHKGILIQAMNSMTRTGRCDGSCGWCQLPQAWRDWAEGGE